MSIAKWNLFSLWIQRLSVNAVLNLWWATEKGVFCYCNFTAIMHIIHSGICGSGVLVSSSPLGQSQTRTDINGENDIPKHFGCATTPDTYVCIQLRLTADPGTQSVKKGPVQYVNPDRYGEEKQGCRNPGNGQVIDPAKTHTSRSLKVRRTYFSRTAVQTRMFPRACKGNACALEVKL